MRGHSRTKRVCTTLSLELTKKHGVYIADFEGSKFSPLVAGQRKTLMNDKGNS